MNRKLGLYITYAIYLFVIFGILFAALQPLFVVAKEAKVIPTRYSYLLGDKVPEFVVDSLIAKHATGTKAINMKKTIYCESHYWNVQSNIISKSGIREQSYGLAQINTYWNPSVTKEQALDVEFAIKWMSDNWETTKWYGYSIKNNSCNPVYI